MHKKAWRTGGWTGRQADRRTDECNAICPTNFIETGGVKRNNNFAGECESTRFGYFILYYIKMTRGLIPLINDKNVDDNLKESACLYYGSVGCKPSPQKQCKPLPFWLYSLLTYKLNSICVLCIYIFLSLLQKGLI